MAAFIHHPFRIDGRGRTQTSTTDAHVRGLIHQVLFTSPGERVNRPDFGCGLLQMVFMPNSSALAASTQFLVHGALQRWLSEWIRVEEVSVLVRDGVLEVQIAYLRRDDGRRRDERFYAPVGRP